MIYIGTSGFSYDDWPNIYSAGTPRNKLFDTYCEWFNAVEINSTFYHIPTPNMMRSLVRRAAGRICFTAKMSERVTHLGELTQEVIAQFSRSLEPAASEDRLGAVLLQFPFRFHNTPDNRTYLRRALAAFREFPLVVEIRHRSWQTDEAMRFFRDGRINLCLLDMPSEKKLPRTVIELTGNIAYLRFHGRNGAHWFEESYPGAPYDYFYSAGEIQGWVEPLKELDRKAATTFAFFNNHVRGQAPENALMLKGMLKGKAVDSELGELFTPCFRRAE